MKKESFYIKKLRIKGKMNQLEKIIIRWIKKIDIRKKWCFVATFLIGMLCHGYVFANKISYHDDIVLNGFGLTFGGGRWALGFLEVCLNKVGGVFSIPWFNGILSLLFIALSAIIIVDIFRVKSILGSILIGCILVVYPVTATAYAYMFNAWSDFLCLFLNVLAVWIVTKNCYSWYRLICGGGIFCIALGIYQAMFPVGAVLFLLALILNAVEKKNINIIKDGSRYLGTLMGGMASYLFITLFLRKISIIELTFYNGVNEIGKLELSKLPMKIGVAYIEFFKANFANIHSSIYFAGIIQGIILCSFFMFIFLIWKNIYKKMDKILLIILVTLLPLGINLIYCFSTQDDFTIHTLMVYPTVLTLIIPIILMDKINIDDIMHGRKKAFILAESGLISIIVLIVGVYVYYDNSAYLKATFLQEQTMAWYNTLISEIKGTEGYRDEYPVAYIGMYEAEDRSFAHIPSMENAVRITGYDLNMQDLVNNYKMYEFMSLRCGYAPELYQDVEKLKNTEEVKNMEIYPDKGSIKVIDNVVVVKLH